MGGFGFGTRRSSDRPNKPLYCTLAEQEDRHLSVARAVGQDGILKLTTSSKVRQSEAT